MEAAWFICGVIPRVVYDTDPNSVNGGSEIINADFR